MTIHLQDICWLSILHQDTNAQSIQYYRHLLHCLSYRREYWMYSQHFSYLLSDCVPALLRPLMSSKDKRAPTPMCSRNQCSMPPYTDFNLHPPGELSRYSCSTWAGPKHTNNKQIVWIISFFIRRVFWLNINCHKSRE